MKRSYDAIAGIYDWLAQLVYGKALRRAQIILVQHIPAGANVLIAGGGTGWILDEITTVHKKGLQIDYVDISGKMIALSRQRNVAQNRVRFFHQSAADFSSNNYDVILTPFFFDNFKDATMQNIFRHLHQQLKQGGLWLYADFQVKGKYVVFKKAMLWIMYGFFRATCNIEANQLPDVEMQFANCGYQLVNGKTFRSEFIVSKIYKKQNKDC